MVKEVINLETSEHVEVDQLWTKIPLDHARYHFYIFQHIYQGASLKSIGL